MKPEYNRHQFQHSKSQRTRRRIMLLALILLLLIFIFSCSLMYHLGKRAKDQAEPNQQTIKVEPEAETETALSVYGVVRYTNGMPCSNHIVELHSTPKTAQTGEDGSFFFYDVEQGDHTLYVKDASGQEKASMSLNISEHQDKGIQHVKVSELDQQIRFEIPVNTILLDMDLEVDEQNQTVLLDADGVSAALTEGRVLTPSGSVQVKENEAVAFASGHYMLPDGTIVLNNGGILLPQQTYLPPNAAGEDLPDGIQMDADGILHLTDGTQIDRSSLQITFSNGMVIQPGFTVKMPDGSILDIPDFEDNAYLIREKNSGLIGTGTAGSRNVGIVNEMQEHGNAGQEANQQTGSGADEEQNASGRNGSAEDTNNQENSTASTQTANASETAGENSAAGNTNANGNTGNSGTAGGSGGSGDSGNSGSGTNPTRPAEEPETVEIGDVKTGKLWKQMASIDLFSDLKGEQAYEKLYPGIEGQYNFYIRNTMKEATYMTVAMEEEADGTNGGSIPLEYKILDGSGSVISGDWKSAAELKEFPVTLQPKQNVNYSIRWRWPYEGTDSTGTGQAADAYDTKLGTSANLNHKLKLVIHIEQ